MPNMPSNYRGEYRDRARRSRNQPPPPQNDSIITALTAQVLICVLLVIVGGIFRNAQSERYDAVSGQVRTMLTDENETARAIEYMENGSVSGVWDYITSIFDGEGQVKEPAPPVVEDEPDGEKAAPDAAVNDAAESESKAETPSMRQYDYLAGSADEAEFVGTGAGGMLPVEIVASDAEHLPAPQGSALSPVILGGKIIPPVTGLITSEFAFRSHPISENDDFHTGMDIAAEEGRSILAALPGEVSEVGESTIYGNYIKLKHSTNLETFYAHCSEILAEEGMKIKQGERIAKVGMTGMATGPHLHFSVIVDGVYTDPYWVLQDHITIVD